MKKILAIIAVIFIFLGVAGFLYIRREKSLMAVSQKGSPNASQNAVNTQNSGACDVNANNAGGNNACDECKSEIKSFNVAQSSLIYTHLYDLKNSDDPSQNDRSVYDELMLRYYSCDALNNKDKEVSTEAGKYIDHIKNAPVGYAQSLKQGLSDILDGKLNTPYLDVFDNVALGDLSKICPDELPAMCRSNVSRLPVANKDVADRNCDGLCSKIENYQNDKTAAQDEILGNSSSQGFQQRLILGMAYRIGGKDLALKFCGETGLNDQQKKDCLAKAYYLDSINISCDDVAAKLADFACKKQNLCQ
jgi:hypothetical protein